MYVRTGDDDVHTQAHQLRSELRQSFHATVAVPALEHDVAPLDVAEITQALLE